MFMFSFISVIVVVFLSGSESVHVFYHLLIYCCRRRSSYLEGRVEIPLIGLMPPHFCACPKPVSGFPTPYVIVFIFVFRSSVKMRDDYSFC